MQSSEALYRIERNGVLIDAPTLAAKATSWASAFCSWKPRRYEIGRAAV
jgi:DNA polymerase-1